MIKNVCCFLGHRKIEVTEELIEKLKELIEGLIADEKIDTFLFGSKSQFDGLCYRVVTELKNKYPKIKRIYVRALYPYISDDYKEYLLKSFEDTYYSEKAKDSGKAIYVERNREMIDKSDVCVFYYNEAYMPEKRKHNRRDAFYYQPKSGTRVAYEYAISRGKKLYNLCK